LDHGHIQPAIPGLLTCSDLPDFLGLDGQEQRELRQLSTGARKRVNLV
jgi:ABC-type transport system involved in cytochrome c biogenesis ATPase subunit